MVTNVVWFKRDLRVQDHAPLRQASIRGRCICLYVYEPELIAFEEFDASHLAFINQSLSELQSALRARGGRLTLRVGPVPDVLDELHQEVAFDPLWSHQETGNALTYARDRQVAACAKAKRVSGTSFPITACSGLCDLATAGQSAGHLTCSSL